MKNLILLLVLAIPSPAAAETVLIRLHNGQPLGSGVVYKTGPQSFGVLTARHVCLFDRDLTVETKDGSLRYFADVLAVTPHNDLCIMEAYGTGPVATPVSPEFIIYRRSGIIHSLFPGFLADVAQRVMLMGYESVVPYGGDKTFVRVFRGTIYPGMSGSPVLNDSGQIIGIVVIQYADEVHGGMIPLPYIHGLIDNTNSLRKP